MRQFRDLPLELRRKIWKAASFIPRNVEIWTKYGRRNLCEIVSRTLPPAVLHICHESREEAGNHYILGSVSTEAYKDQRLNFRCRVYINPIVDTVCLPSPREFSLPQSAHWGLTDVLSNWRLKSLAINILSPRSVNNLEHVLQEISSTFAHLMMSKKIESIEELILFADRSCSIFGYTGEEGRLRGYESDFKELPQVELEEDHPALLADYKFLDSRISESLKLSEPLAKYISIRKRLCRLESLDSGGECIWIKPMDSDERFALGMH
jgi:hypothetical protein